MVINKYTPNESVNRMKLMMNYNVSKTLKENEQIISYIDEVKSNNDDFLFDFVISENNGFVIYMDNVISKKHGFVGDLWENTWVFNEIIRENINKYSSVIGENIERDLDSVLMSINWTKEFVIECILSMGENFVNEQFFSNLWDKTKQVGSRIVQGAKKAGSDLAQGAKKVLSKAAEFGKKLLMGPILGTMRWIRRNAYTSMGMVVDIVTAMLPATTGLNKIIWVLIVILDIYEIASGQKDTKDIDRLGNPYMWLIIDIISMLFSVGAGFIFKKSAQATIKTGAKLPSSTAKLLQSVLEKIPGLKNTLSSIGNWLTKKLPKTKSIIDFVLRQIDKVFKFLENFIKQLFSKQGAIAVATGTAIAYFFKPRLLQLGDVGKDVSAVNTYLSEYHNIVNGNYPGCTISDDLIKNIQASGDKFTKYTEAGVKQIESCIPKTVAPVIKQPDGKISNEELAVFCNVEMDSRGIAKLIPHETKAAFSSVIGQVAGGAAKFAKDKLPSQENIA